MGVVGATQNVTTTATPLGSSGPSRRLLVVRNPTGSGATIYIGGPTVTAAAAAFELAAGAAPLIFTSSDDSLAGESWHARTSSGTATGVAVTEG